MPSSRSRPQRDANGDGVRLWDIPTSVWTYGFTRAVAFAIPYATGTGSFGLGAVAVLALYVFVIRRSRFAWSALLVLDVLSFASLLATQSVTGAPWLCTSSPVPPLSRS